ncbi:hypothetical protein ACR6C2_25270 [Streptomyces sp. INA 01156]
MAAAPSTSARSRRLQAAGIAGYSSTGHRTSRAPTTSHLTLPVKRPTSSTRSGVFMAG